MPDPSDHKVCPLHWRGHGPQVTFIDPHSNHFGTGCRLLLVSTMKSTWTGHVPTTFMSPRSEMSTAIGGRVERGGTTLQQNTWVVRRVVRRVVPGRVSFNMFFPLSTCRNSRDPFSRIWFFDHRLPSARYDGMPMTRALPSLSASHLLLALFSTLSTCIDLTTSATSYPAQPSGSPFTSLHLTQLALAHAFSWPEPGPFGPRRCPSSPRGRGRQAARARWP